jgi:hypothetical protein
MRQDQALNAEIADEHAVAWHSLLIRNTEGSYPRRPEHLDIWHSPPGQMGRNGAFEAFKRPGEGSLFMTVASGPNGMNGRGMKSPRRLCRYLSQRLKSTLNGAPRR